MKIRDLVLAVFLLFIARGFAFADGQLDKAEILQIFQTLTDQPRKTWIPTGVVEAMHLEYKQSKGYITESTVIVKYDGDRFYWEINVESSTKQSEPQWSGDGISSRDTPDPNWNKKRVFAWDGERYTMYFRPSNHAIVTENPHDMPVVVNGPLTAGVVPWGYGIYTLENLLAAESSGEIDSYGQIHLTVRQTNTPEIIFTLDPAKNDAVLSWSINDPGRSSIITTYGDYQLVSGRWIPTTIILERYDDSKESPELLSYDYWEFTSISIGLPQPDSFSVVYETAALVEFYSSITDKPLSYRYSNEVDMDSLLQNRLVIASAHDTLTQNCATVAMKYVSAQLDKNVADQQLAPLVNEPNEDTSLYALRQFAQGLGFHCLAVKTNIQTLKNLKNCQAILHLPGAKHYVVLEYIDDEYIWLIDLDSNKFYYRTKLDGFDLDWSAGTALLISNEPLDLAGTFTEIGDEELHKIIGSDGFGTYSCTDLIQQYNVIFCSEPIFGLCGGLYTIFYNRYGCELDEDGGSCTGTGVVGNVSSPCIEDPYNPGYCIITGEWFSRYIRACR